MTVPKFNKMYNKVLKVLADGDQYNNHDIDDLVAYDLGLSDEDKLLTVKSGGLLYKNRVGWTRTYLKQAGLIESQKRNYSNITQEGLNVLESADEVTTDYLKKYSSFNEFLNRERKSNKKTTISKFVNNKNLTPDEIISEVYDDLKHKLCVELLDEILKNDPIFFERLVLKLLLKMGYGGFREDAGIHTPFIGDEGLDGIINKDKLSLEQIGIQAKRYAKDNTVGKPEIQKFVGALIGKHLNEGVFFTISSFSSQAMEYAKNQSNLSVVLIDGEKLTDLMIEYDLGVSTKYTYIVKKLDNDF